MACVDELLQWFDQLKDWGFSPGQAHAMWREHQAIASPILWSHQALRKDARLRAAAFAQRSLHHRLIAIDHPRAWEHYWRSMPDLLRSLEKKISQRGKRIAGSMSDHWSTIAMDEDATDLAWRMATPNPNQREGETIVSWEDLVDHALRRKVLDRLIEQAPSTMALVGIDEDKAWQQTLNQTGLRSIRWGWLDTVSPHIEGGMVRGALIQAQSMLSKGIGWEGQVLGLGGHTSLVLIDRGGSDGLVQPDQTGMGQTLNIGTWSILAHEWAHVLDRAISAHAKGHKPWATTTLLRWSSEKTPPALLLAWFETLAAIQMESPSETVLAANRDEIPHWALRVSLALGGLGSVRDEILRQHHLIGRGQWNIGNAEQGWLRVLDDRPVAVLSAQVRRTAQLLARDTAFSLLVGEGRAQGGWMEYLNDLPESDIEGNPCKPGDKACPRYLTHPVEVMARSFEAAMGCDISLDSVWTPHQLRPNAGLVWPLHSEARSQRDHWRKTLDEIAVLSGDGMGIKKRSEPA